MKQKLILIFLVSLVTLTNLHANKNMEDNRFGFGIKFGGGFYEYTETIGYDIEIKEGAALNCGLVFIAPITKRRLSLATEILYSLKASTADNNTQYQISYFEIPVMANFRIFEKRMQDYYRIIDLVGGMAGAKSISSKVSYQTMVPEQRMPGGWYEAENKSYDYEQAQKYNTSFILGVNFEYIKRQRVIVGLRYSKMLNNIYINETNVKGENLKTKSICYSLELSYCW